MVGLPGRLARLMLSIFSRTNLEFLTASLYLHYHLAYLRLLHCIATVLLLLMIPNRDWLR